MDKRVSVIVVALGLLLCGVLSNSTLASPEGLARPQEADELAKKVAALEVKIAEQGAEIATLEEAFRRVGVWFQGIPATVKTLESGLDDVHKKGFTYAGANLPAREALLATLRQLARGLASGNPFVAPAGR